MNSKELLEKTGISRATLNNYISWGLVPRPEVLPPGPQEGAAPRIGYFPDEVAQRIAEIQRLKKDGWSIARIAEHFGASQSAPSTARPPARTAEAVRPSPDRVPMPSLSIGEIDHPAYVVDRLFNVTWCNAAAASDVLRLAESRGLSGSHNVFSYLLSDSSGDPDSRDQILRFHFGLAKRHGADITQLCRDLPPAEAALLQRLYEQAQPAGPALLSHAVVSTGDRNPRAVCLYAVQFRERLLFVQVPSGAAPPLLVRDFASGEPARRRLPALSQVAVLVSDLQQPTSIWSALPPEEYFELINQIWLTLDPIVRSHHGTHGKHPGDGLACYFFPQRDSSHLWNALCAARDMREAMRRVSKEWQLRKRWATELYMNTGLDEGQQWLGTLKSAGRDEFTMLGDTLNRAARISDFARFGAIWATKNLVGKLTDDEKQRLKFGIHRKNSEGREILVPSIFSDVDSLLDLAAPAEKLKLIARLPITEIVEIALPGKRDERMAGTDAA